MKLTDSGHSSGEVRALKDIHIPEVPLPLEVADLAVLALESAPLVVAIDGAEQLYRATLIDRQVLGPGRLDVERRSKSGRNAKNYQAAQHFHVFGSPFFTSGLYAEIFQLTGLVGRCFQD